jgi:menaquinone-dependent protoporphyrinogen oxidase
MKTLIIFGTRSGTTEKCANRIREVLSPAEADVIDVRHFRRTELAPYNSVIVGTSVYMGKIHPKVKRFLSKYSDELLKMKLHLFVCGLAQGDDGTAQLKKQMSEELYSHAIQVKHLGCEANYDRLNPFYRAIMKKIVETEKPQIGLLDNEINTFAAGVQENEPL